MNFRNIFWNLFGLGLPLLVALFSIPFLLDQIGLEKFGFLGLAWGVVGYASLLDLGMGRAVTRTLSLNRGSDREFEAMPIIRSANAVTLVLSAFFAAAFIKLAFMNAGDYIAHSETTDLEIRLSLLILAATLPLQALSLTFKGVNEAYLNFRGISLVRVMLGLANFGAPCVVSLWTTQLHYLVLTLFFARLVAVLAYFILSRLCLPSEVRDIKAGVQLTHIRNLFVFGGWIAAAGLIGPFLVQSDRFFIGVLMSADAVSRYVVPFDIITQTMIVTGAVTTIAFPAISNLLMVDPGQAGRLFRQWTLRIAAIMFLILGLLFWFLPILLPLWVGDNLGTDSIVVGRILCVGVFFFSVGSMQTSYLHAQGRSKITCLILLLELPLYLIALMILIPQLGVVGAALCWSVRMFADMCLLALAVSRSKPIATPQ